MYSRLNYRACLLMNPICCKIQTKIISVSNVMSTAKPAINATNVIVLIKI